MERDNRFIQHLVGLSGNISDVLDDIVTNALYDDHDVKAELKARSEQMKTMLCHYIDEAVARYDETLDFVRKGAKPE